MSYSTVINKFRGNIIFEEILLALYARQGILHALSEASSSVRGEQVYDIERWEHLRHPSKRALHQKIYID